MSHKNLAPDPLQVTDLGVEDEALSAGLGELIVADLLLQLVRDLHMNSC